MVEHPTDRQYVHLRPIPITSLPDHPSLAQHQTTSNTATTTAAPPPSLETLTASILNEAQKFAQSTFPEKFKVKGPSRESPPSTARVDLLTADLVAADGDTRVPPSQIKTESWFARRSTHTDAREKGTATWAEFENGLYKNHSQNEMEYTPDCFDARHILHWDFAQSNGTTGDSAGGQVEGWTDVGMDIFEMGHKIPAPLANRVFPLLIVRGKPTSVESGQEFITAQIPVDLSAFSEAFYSNGRHRKDGETAIKKEKVIIGSYVSIERVKKLGDGMIVWEMVLASDAKGWVPLSMQKMGIPNAIIKDVGLFLGWTDQQRKTDGKP